MFRPSALFILLASLLLRHTAASPLPQDGGGSSDIPDGSLGYDPSVSGDTQPGSSGADTGVRLGKGAIIAIAVVAGVIVIAGGKSIQQRSLFGHNILMKFTVTMAILFWGAKKRHWAVADTMRRSVRRVTTGLKNLTPRTPHKMTFSPIEKRRAGDIGNGLLLKKATTGKPYNDSGKMGRDVEKLAGGASASNESFVKPPMAVNQYQVTVEGGVRKQRPVPPKVQVPGNTKFEVESPKTPMWNRVFGR